MPHLTGVKRPCVDYLYGRQFRGFAGILGRARMQGGWHDFDYWRERQRDLLGEVEEQRLARTQRQGWTERLEDYRRLLGRFMNGIKGLSTRTVPSRGAFPPDEEVTSSRARAGLVEAIFEEGAPSVRSSSVIELHREAEGYVIQEVDLGTGDHILYLSTEEPEWAAWIWEQRSTGNAH
jgi:hypothetical protein